MADLRITTTRGSDTILAEATVQGLKTSVHGPLLRPDDMGYDEARKVFNAMHDKHPALIVRCTGVADVIAAVAFARTHDLLVAVRGGDHSVAGHSICAGGLMIDLSPMQSVRVDPTKQTARAEGGARWRDFDRRLLQRLYISPMSYTVLQAMTDDLFPRRRQYYWKGCLMNHISDDAIDTMLEYFSAVPSPYTVMGFQQLGNAANRVGPDETAFSHREALYDFLMLSGWENLAEAERNIRWTRELNDAMQPFLHGGLYVNALGEEDFQHRIRAAYRPKTYARLVALKNTYDSTNFFRLNPNIKPTM
jgi:hypothetical protein